MASGNNVFTTPKNCIAVFGGLGLYSKINSEYNTGMAMEVALSARYQDNQNQLDTSTKKIIESVGIANLKSDKMRQIISDAVKGRYEGKAQQPGTGGAMFSANDLAEFLKAHPVPMRIVARDPRRVIVRKP